MVLGHFGVAAAAKPAAPVVAVWAMMVAAQAMEFAFLAMAALGLESITMGPYGQSTINAFYSHSLVGALIIAAVVFAIGKGVWKTQQAAWTLAILSFSHWILDFVVHRQDMPLLAGNLGNLPLMGLGLWDYPWIALAIEIVIGVIGLVIYFRWASQNSASNRRWYLGPVITAVIFVALILADLPGSPVA